MSIICIKPGVYWIGVNDRTTDLFEGLWPISQTGVSYNAYLIDDEKKVIVDLAKAIKTDDFIAQISEVADPASIDYVIVNHVEPDHTGVLRILAKISSRIRFLATPKARKMLQDFYGIGDRVQEVADGETLSIGTRTLRFVHVPFVHWPETMVTYAVEDKILFSCDAFGGYGALRGAIFDDECSDQAYYEKESLRYYANIVAKFHVSVLNAIAKLKDAPLDVIAPSHGLVWRTKPGRIVELYRRWSEYGRGAGEPAITLMYGSMYGNTEKAMNAVAQGISSQSVNLEIFDVARTHVSYILPYLWCRAGVMIGAPTYEAGLFPPIADVLSMAGRKGVRNKKAAMFGSFGWSGGALKEMKALVEPLKWDIAETIEFAGGPTAELLKKAEDFGARFARYVKGQSAELS